MSKTLFFDLDGTLTNSEVGIVRSIRYALDKLNATVPQNEDLTWCIGPPLLDSFAKLAGEEHAEAGLVFYRERFSSIGWKENDVYPGVAAMLDTLRARGHDMHVATSKPHVYANKIVEHFELKQYFDRVFGPELDGSRSDKSELLAYAVSQVGCGSKAVMIGDRKHDIVGAKNNGLGSVGVTYGFGTKDELEQAGAESIVSSPIELLSLAY